MSAAPWVHLLTLEEWDALPEEENGYSELIDGVLVVTPTPAMEHQIAQGRLYIQLEGALPEHGLVSVQHLEAVLVESFPPLVRVPDIAVVTQELWGTRPKRLRAADVLVAIEVISPGSRRVDRIHKMADYADAGIPDYWVVDLAGGTTIEGYRLVDGVYEKVAEATSPKRFEVIEPVPLSIDLTELTR